MPDAMEPRYDHTKLEGEIYARWEKSGFFNPDVCVEKGVTDKDAEPFSLSLPPPNVTGTLHIGHAFEDAIQDIMVRYQRMRGRRTLWVPGTDHAAIATQAKVEGMLYKEEKKTKYDLGREEFLRRVENFAQESHDTIVKQVRRMGTSLDWSREAYTFDEKRSFAVRAAFEKMYDAGLIYRGARIVNWDPKLKTTVSDDEIAWKEEPAPFYYLKYGPFVIATARPETKFGDKYVVMHPNDKRYKKYKHGDTLKLEWINGSVTATIIKDDVIDMEFGTGVMTITPWHDATDFGIAERHKLDKEQIIDFDGKLLPIAGEFAGIYITKARPLIVEKLRAKGLLEKVDEKYLHRVATNSRGGGLIEPQIKMQWWVDVNKPFAMGESSLKGIPKGSRATLKELMRKVVKSGQVKIVPERFAKIYFHWINNLHDWCISRQLWYGHRIPVWYCLACGGKADKKMGFAGDVVPQVFDRKTRTYRLRDHGFTVGDRVAFENSATGELFGYGTMTEIAKTTVAEIDLKDPKHWKTYEAREQLIAAFKRHYPEKDIRSDTPVWLYTYVFDQTIKKSDGIRVNPEIKSRWFLVRHGETDSVKNNTVDGWQDTPLNETGLAQAEKHAEGMRGKKIDLIISSDLKRCKETAEIFARTTGAKIIYDPDLRERNWGALEGIPKSERDLHHQDASYSYHGKPERGESFADVEDRSWNAFQKYLKLYADKNVVFSIHGGPIRLIMGKLRKWSFEEVLRYYPPVSEMVALDISAPCAQCKGEIYEQDPDTFDTWFSSGTWTFSTLGWPEKTKDLATYHPNSFMAPGYEILFLWVARMILMSGCLLGQIPFKIAYLHGIVRDIEGRKFSKSLGNGIDPLELANTYGADAVRLSEPLREMI